jgi:pimeloyl-ACP methyl ester carboxylesterase
MEIKHFNNGKLCATYTEAGAGPIVHFAHANGFSAGAYAPAIELLAREFHVLGLNICGQCECKAGECGSAAPGIESWHKLADKFAAFVKFVCGGGPIVAAGHSIGGVVTLLCAVKHPGYFKKIILLDPVLLEPKIIFTIRMANLLRQSHRAPLAVRARKRRDGWGSRDEALEYFRGRPLFEGWPDESLRAYVKYGLADAPGGGVVLACPPEIEAQGFSTYPTDIWRRVRQLRVPALFVRGGDSDALTPGARDMFMRAQPGAAFVEMQGAGHLFPMQRPEKTAQIISDFLNTP